ncbi:kinesin [Seiridium cupressi]
MESFFTAAKRKWTHTDDLQIVGNWYDFEKHLLRHQRWSWGKLNVATLQTFQDMYCHLQWRVRLAESACSEAADEIETLQQKLYRLIPEPEILVDRVNKIEQYVDGNDDGDNRGVQEGGGSASSPTHANASTQFKEEIERLKSQLQAASAQKDELELALEAGRSQMDELKLAAEKSEMGHDLDNTAHNDELRDLQAKVQSTQSRLDESVAKYEQLELETQSKVKTTQSKLEEFTKKYKQLELESQEKVQSTQLELEESCKKYEQLELDRQAEEAQRQNRISDLTSQLSAKERDMAATTERITELQNIVKKAEQSKLDDQAEKSQRQKQIDDLKFQLAAEEREKVANLERLAELENSIKRYEQLELGNQAGEAQQQKNIDDLKSQLTAEERAKVVNLERIAELEESVRKYEQLELGNQAGEAQRQNRIDELMSQLTVQERDKAAGLQRITELEEAIEEHKKSIEEHKKLELENQAEEARRQKRIDNLASQLAAEERHKAASLEQIADLEEQLQSTNDKYAKAQDSVRAHFDELQDLKGNVRVMCRIRPQLNDQDDHLERITTMVGPHSDDLQIIEMAKRRAKSDEEVDRFEMERVFEKTERNEDVFAGVGELVKSAIYGRNVCIFAYGQTGSGKTYTMNYPWDGTDAFQGSDIDYGIIPRSVMSISDFIETNKGIWSIAVTGKYIELYLEKAYDLLKEKSAQEVEVSAVKNDSGKQFYEANSTEIDLTADGDFETKVQDMLAMGARGRRVRATKGNEQSSRSHSILTLIIVAKRIDGKSKATTRGLLNLIDLAGSERNDGEDKASQKESININSSLSSLRACLGDMADPKKTFVNFRGSLLTRLLQPSLGARCKTLMFVMVSPLKKDREESRNTLEFAMTASKAKLGKAIGGAPAGRQK